MPMRLHRDYPPTYLPTYTQLSNYLLIYLPTPAFPRQRISGKRFALPELINSEAPNEISKAKDAVRK